MQDSQEQKALKACHYLNENYQSLLHEINQDLQDSMDLRQENVITKTAQELKTFKRISKTELEFNPIQLKEIQEKTVDLLNLIRQFDSEFPSTRLESDENDQVSPRTRINTMHSHQSMQNLLKSIHEISTQSQSCK